MIPSLKEWDEKYRDQGLVVIGNHYPEFSFEEDLANLQAAVTKYGIEYAVTQDNDGATWRAYKNRYWPTLYLIDKNGRIRYVHIGEGNYDETEAAIQSLLAE
ncbi:MAG: redoxin domain-containing protein [Anaerolineales bacterium]|nr:redoxin domain-containing protein [Anaerolineales bacterium]